MIWKFPLWLAGSVVAFAWYTHLLEMPVDGPIRMARCYALGTDPSLIDEGQVSSGIQFFQAVDHWTATATDGGSILTGTPITLTWGIVPDGTTIPSFSAGDSGGSDLRARLDEIYGEEATWMPLFQSVFDRWGEVTGITYVHEANDDGASFSSFSNVSLGMVGIRPDVRIGGRRIDGDGKTLAFNFLPTVGDMVLDTDDSFFEDTSGNSIFLRNVVSHEHGHGIGLDHVCPVNQTKLMEPFVSTSFDGPQHDDILGGQRVHGDPLEPNDGLSAASELGVVSLSPIGVEMVSLDGVSDTDYFQFSTTIPETELSVTVIPIGEVYLEGSQNIDGSCAAGSNVDSQTQRNLGIEVLDSLGNELASVDAQGAGSQEVLVVTLGSALGPYVVKVTGDTADSIQLYNLSLVSLNDDLLETEVTIDSEGNLVIQDVETTNNDMLTLSHDAETEQVVISDPNRLLGTSIATATGNGTHEVRVPSALITGSSIKVLAGGGDDRLTIDHSTSELPADLEFDGGENSAFSNNVMEVNGRDYIDGWFVIGEDTELQISLDNAYAIQCVNVQRVEGDIGLTHEVVQYSSSNDVIELSSPVYGETRVAAAGLTQVILAHPASLVVMMGGGNDVITLAALDDDYPATLSLHGQDDDDEIVLADPLAMALTTGLSCIAENVVVRASGTQVAGGAWFVDGQLSLDGQDRLTLATALTFSSESRLSLVIGEDRVDLLDPASIDISGLNLELLMPPAAFKAGDVLSLVNTAANASVIGNFKLLGEGAEVSVGAAIYRVTYVGGDGDDICVMALLDYGQWVNMVFPPTELDRAPGDDPDNDEWPNGLAYLLGLDPTNFEEDPYTLVVGETESVLSYPRASFLPGNLEVVEWSQNMVDWFQATEIPVENGGYVSYTIPFGEEGARRFFRIRIVIAP